MFSIQPRHRFVAIAVAACATPSARAEVGADGTAVLASDKVYRGLSQSRGRASWLVDANVRNGAGWSAGVGLATLAPGAEWLARVSHAWQPGDDWTVLVGVEHQGYAGTRRPLFRHDELYASLAWQGRMVASLAALPNLRIGASAGGRPPRPGWAFVGELGWHQPWGDRLAVDAGIGYYDLHRVVGTAAGYAYGSLGLGWRYRPALQLQLTFVASNAAARGIVPRAIAGERWIASLAWAF